MKHRVTAVVLALLGTFLPGLSTAADGFGTEFLDIPAADGVALGSMVMEPSSPGPHPLAVLIGAWGGGRTQNIIPAKELADRGYVVISYGARGFGESTGEVEVAGTEDITDVSTVIDWALRNTDADPSRIGVGGVSYGAGIAMIASGFDARIKAVASLSGWADLVASLTTNDTRHGLAGLVLYLSGKANGTLSAETDTMLRKFLEPRISDADSEAVIDWAEPRSPVTYLDRINANHPAVLAIQTWSETVFPPDQMVDFYRRLTGPKRAEFVPGDHAATESGGLLGLPSDTWTSVYRWFDAHVAGTDTAIEDEPPVVTRARPGMRQPTYQSTWDDVVGTPVRSYLGEKTLQPQPAEWSRTVAANRDTVANGGIPLATYSLEALTGNPPNIFLPQVDRGSAGVWHQEPGEAPVEIRGSMHAHLTVVPPGATGTAVAYVYDVDPFGVGSLINYLPYSWKNATPGQPLAADFHFAPTAYTVAAGHHLALVVDSKDPLFLDWNSGDGRLGFASTTADPAWLDVAVHTGRA
ncbi:CocE/NonD family hydrolase [Amycolatopsis endophytica]|uniref:Putative CocE/NonD family hydrolase n=1 Tax=Amycolatopsis endophytica TaxID=860233 RepID=A0A853B409_9PSEU|nr:CocE/NonD family hydrolase [Amycolatopsis endophytica]NYI89491.1 putative CocE/NonD family hydrolase [Amycolatopsis endophytica]